MDNSKNLRNEIESKFENFALSLTRFTGSTPAFVISVFLILIWVFTGPVFDYSPNWQLIVNTGTTIVTFLMVFLIQRTQNKDALAIQLKLNELIAAINGASNRLIDAEDLTENELKQIKESYNIISKKIKTDPDIKQKHSIEESGDIFNN